MHRTRVSIAHPLTPCVTTGLSSACGTQNLQLSCILLCVVQTHQLEELYPDLEIDNVKVHTDTEAEAIQVVALFIVCLTIAGIVWTIAWASSQ